MNKGYIKLWRSEADIPQLWESALLFSTYQKLKMLADRTDWAVAIPVRKLALKMGMSVDTLRKATTELARLGLLRTTTTAEGVSRFELVFKDTEPDLCAVSTAAKSTPKKPDAVLNSSTPAVLKISTPPVLNSSTTKAPSVLNSSTPAVLNFRTPLYSKQESIDNNKTTTPLLFPQVAGTPSAMEQENDFMACFSVFWNAYPNKKSKQRAIKRWKKGKYNLAEILPILEKQKLLRDWVKADGQFVPRADAYLNQRRWEDQLPSGEEAYILNFKEPKTQRERVLKGWLEATNPELLKNENQKINSVFEFDRIFFEKIVAMCGNDLHRAFDVMRHGWRLGCTTLRAISERAASYLDELKSEEYKK